MLFVAIGWDAADSREKRPHVRPAHLEHWSDWNAAGRVVTAGAVVEFVGSLFIVEAETQAEVEAKVAADPYVTSGVFARTEVHPYRQALPTPRA